MHMKDISCSVGRPKDDIFIPNKVCYLLIYLSSGKSQQKITQSGMSVVLHSTKTSTK